MPGEGACSRRPGKPGEGAACQPARPGGPGGRKFVRAPGDEGRSGCWCSGGRPGAEEAPPGVACAGAHGGWAACSGEELPWAERATRSTGSGAGAGGAASLQRSLTHPGFVLRRRPGSPLPPPPAALWWWQLSFSCPSLPRSLSPQPGASALPGLRKALGRSAGCFEIQLLTRDPVRPAL